MSSLARKHRRNMQRALAYSGATEEGAAALKEIADIYVLQPEIEQKAVMAFATMTIWTLHNKFGFGKSRLRKFYLELSELGESMKSSIAPVSLKDMQDTLKAECELDFLGDERAACRVGRAVAWTA